MTDDLDPLAFAVSPTCPSCLEPMEPHPTFDQWWCESCQVALSPEERADDLGDA